MRSEKKFGVGKFLAGAALGAGLGVLFAPKSGSETRKELKKKMDDLVAQIKDIDVDEVKKEFDKKVEEIKDGLADLDREKVLELAKEKGNDLKEKAQELVEMAQKENKEIKKAIEIIDEMSMDEKEWELYESRRLAIMDYNTNMKLFREEGI